MDLMDEYRKRFGEYPPATVEWSSSPEEIEHAIITGEPISIADAPEIGPGSLA